MTSFLGTWFSNLHILWNLPKAIRVQSFHTVDCLCQVLQRDYKNTMMTSLWRHFIFLGFEVSIFCETGYNLSTCQISNPSVIWIKFYGDWYKTAKKPLWRNYDVSSQYLVFITAHFVKLIRSYQPAKYSTPCNGDGKKKIVKLGKDVH